MMNVIKTAIITIIISFISGLLLDRYKNLAPRILCDLKKKRVLNLNDKKIYEYVLTVRNLSSKTINDITLNVHGEKSRLKISESKITKGLKFDTSIEEDFIEVSIPFLNKNDEFSVKLYDESQDELYNKPIVTLRSPEKFKQVDTEEKKGFLTSLFNGDKNDDMLDDNEIIAKKNRNRDNISNKSNIGNKPNKSKRANSNSSKNNLSINKKVVIVITSIVLVVFVGFLGKIYFQKMATDAKVPDKKTEIKNESPDTIGKPSDTIKKPNTKSSQNRTTKNPSTKSSNSRTTEDSNKNSLNNQNDENKNNNTSQSRPSTDTPANESRDENKNTQSNPPNGGSNINSDKSTSGGDGEQTNTRKDEPKDNTGEDADKTEASEDAPNSDTNQNEGK